MYVTSIHIYLVSSKEESKLSSLEEQVTIPYQMHRALKLTKEIIQHAHVLLLEDKLSRAEWDLIHQNYQEDTVVVVCDSNQAKENLEYIDFIWDDTMSYEALQLSFKTVLKMANKVAQAWLYQHCLTTSMDSVPQLIWFKDVRGAHLKVNESFCEAVNKTKQQIQNRGHYYIWDIPMEEYQKGEYICLESEEETMEKRCTCVFDENVKTSQGMRKFKTFKTPIFDRDGTTLLGTAGVANDVTDYLNCLKEITVLLDNLPLGAILCDLNWNIITMNKHVAMISNENGKELMEYSNYLEAKSAYLYNINELDETHKFEAMIKMGDSEKIVEGQETLLEDVFQKPVGYICLFRNITLDKIYEQKMEKLANTDALTGLASRSYLYSYMEKNGKPALVLYIDVDRFKSINDRFGHGIGDEALQIIGKEMQESFPNDLCARLGGDEFIIAIYEQEENAKLTAKIENLQRAVNARFKALTSAGLTLSIGVAKADENMSIEDLITNSDAAMYHAKRNGKDQYVFF